MAVTITALVLTALVSLLLPCLQIVILAVRREKERKGILLYSLAGILLYVVTQWGLRNQGLSWVIEQAGWTETVQTYYLLSLFLLSFAGSLFLLVPTYVILRRALKKQLSFAQAMVFGLAYAMAEAVLLVGYQSVKYVIQLLKKEEGDLIVTNVQLFLSTYERLLFFLIHTAVFAGFAWMLRKGFRMRACAVFLLVETLIAFLPGFFMAFSTVQYLEVYDHVVGLFLIYVFLTAVAVTGAVILRGIRYEFDEPSSGR